MNSSERRSLGAALAAVFLGALDLTVIATILPGMVTDLRINAADVDRYVWIVNSYLLAYVVAIPVVGRLSDIIGRTLAFQGSLGLFLIGSVWCAMASDLPAMVAGRAIQGAGGGLVAELAGSYTNVVGLPLEETLAAIADLAGGTFTGSMG